MSSAAGVWSVPIRGWKQKNDPPLTAENKPEKFLSDKEKEDILSVAIVKIEGIKSVYLQIVHTDNNLTQLTQLMQLSRITKLAQLNPTS